jgi:SAM-dependent methyltransferase
MTSLRAPWWMKLSAKIILARIPISYSFWQRIGLFRHGHMDRAKYAISIVSRHVRNAGLVNQLSGKVVVELGPGDTISSGVVLHSMGASSYLIDAGTYAKKDVNTYLELVKAMDNTEVPLEFSQIDSFDSLLEHANISYQTDGLESMKSIPDNSVDFIFSHAVLEHIALDEFLPTMEQCRRILKPSGVISHKIDFKDHLDGGLNNLRFSKNIWESNLFVNSGFYTNRIRFSQMQQLIEQAGFGLEILSTQRWDKVPISRNKLAGEFRNYSDDDLSVNGAEVLLRLKKN